MDSINIEVEKLISNFTFFFKNRGHTSQTLKTKLEAFENLSQKYLKINLEEYLKYKKLHDCAKSLFTEALKLKETQDRDNIESAKMSNFNQELYLKLIPEFWGK